MGICASCLGLSRPHTHAESAETSRLLYDDPYQPNYGGLTNGVAHGGSQVDQQDIKREREALERVCLQTSDKLIDIFALQHQPADADAAETKSTRYQRLLDKTSVDESAEQPKLVPSDEVSDEEEAWLSAMAEGPQGSSQGWRKVNNGEVGELVGTFSAPPPKGKKALKGLRA